jgi:uncharacterized iron-regulated membrane protein
MKTKNIKRWFFIHRWSSLICTLFLLILCLTGLPLIFGDEIDGWLNPHPPYEVLPATTPMADLDRVVHTAQGRYPGEIVTSLFIDDDEPQIIASLSTSWAETMKDHSDSTHFIRFDARTARVLEDGGAAAAPKETFIGVMLDLHRSLFAGLPGELFMGFMGLLFVLAILSGVLLYGPFMKKLDFGTVRKQRATRLKWLDLHNLLGIVTLAWTAVVGITGVINELSTPLFGLWQMTDVRAMLKPYQGMPAPRPEEFHSVQAVFDTAQSVLPGMKVTSVVFPGAPFASSQHYLLWAKGSTPLRSRLFTPVLVDARTGRLAAIVKMPGYLRALEVSRPLHFGDYGGMPLKVIWAIFDVITIVVLISGIYLWWVRRKLYGTYFSKILEGGEALAE